jgi:type I restriction enzyme M protein
MGKVIDARKMGVLISRVQRELREDEDVDEIGQIADTYHAWRNHGGKYEDKPGFCKSAPLEEIRKHNCVLTPGRYVGADELEDDSVPFAERFQALKDTLGRPFGESNQLQDRLKQLFEMVVVDESN